MSFGRGTKFTMHVLVLCLPHPEIFSRLDSNPSDKLPQCLCATASWRRCVTMEVQRFNAEGAKNAEVALSVSSLRLLRDSALCVKNLQFDF